MAQTKRTGGLKERELNPSSGSFDDIVSASLSDVNEKSKHEPNKTDHIRSNLAEMNRRSGNDVAASLRNSETGENSTSSPKQDIGHQERASWDDNVNKFFDKTTAHAGQNFLVKRKRGLIGWAVALALSGGMFGMTSILSGPAQWVQVMSFLKDMTQWVSDIQTGARYLHNLKVLANVKDSMSDAIQNSRVGPVGKRLAQTALDRMEERGFDFSKRASGNTPSITIDTTKEYGNLFNQDAKGGNASDALKQKRLDTLASKYGLEKGSLGLDSLSSDGKLTINFDKMGYRQSVKFFNATNNVSRFDIIGKVQVRSALKKIGKIRWLHPIKKLEQKALDKFADWLTDRIERQALKGFTNIDDAVKNVQESSEAEALADGKDAKAAKEAGEKAASEAREAMTKSLGEISSDATEKIVQYVIGKTGTLGAKVGVETVMKAIPIVGWIMAAVQVRCMLLALGDGIGAQKYVDVVAAAIGSTTESLAVGSQAMSGHSQDDDIDMTQLGHYTQLKLYNSDVSEVVAESDDNGQQTGQKTVGRTDSSWWNAPAVRSALGERYSVSARSGVPQPLDDVSNADLSFGGNELAGDIWSGIMDFMGSPLPGFNIPGLSTDPIMKVVCGVFNKLDELMVKGITKLWDDSIFGKINKRFGITDTIISTAAEMAPEIAKTAIAWASNLYTSATGWFRGDPLNVRATTPEKFGSIDMYGGIFLSNEQMLSVGARATTEEEKTELLTEHKQYLAEKQAAKPLLARLFDPTDYNSTIAQIGRATGIDTSSQSFSTQLKNVGKVFASTPKLLSFALGKIGSNANAVSADSYDYGVPMFAFSQDEMTQLTGGENGTDTTYDFDVNTEKVFNMIDAGEVDAKKVKECFAVEIGDKSTGYTVKQIDNQDGKAWNYADSFDDSKDSNGFLANDGGYNGYKEDCMNSDMLPVRTYILDYNSIVSADCYENDGWEGGEAADSCAEMGFGDGSNNKAPASASTTTANGTNQELAAQILQQDIYFQSGTQAEMQLIADTGNSNTPAKYNLVIDNNLLAFVLDSAKTFTSNGLQLSINAIADTHDDDGLNHPKGLAIDVGVVGGSIPSCTDVGAGSKCKAAQDILDQVGAKYGISCQVAGERMDQAGATHAHCSTTGG